jgi:hypothetical protein
MSEERDTDDTRRVPPDGRGWREAQRRVAERNDQARKAGKAERAEHERQIAEMHRRAERNDNVYR